VNVFITAATLRCGENHFPFLADSMTNLKQNKSRQTQSAAVGDEEKQSIQAEVFDLTFDAVVVRDIDGSIQLWNKGAEELYGFASKEALGTKYDELLHTEYPQNADEIISLAHLNGRWDGELGHTSRAGEPLTVRSRWTVKFNADGQPYRLVEINRNISDQKNALKNQSIDRENREIKVQERIVEVADAEELLRTKVLEIEKSDEQRELRVQERIVELAASKELLESKVSELEKADEQRELRVQERIIELAESKQLLQSKVMEIESADEQRELKVRERITELAESKELLNTKVMEIERSDLQRELRATERFAELAASKELLQSKAMEIEKADEQRELRVVERLLELAESESILNSKVMELERSNEELQQFAYICSHDLQEPLRVISNYTQLLSKRYKGTLDEKADLFIGFAVDAAKRMQDLINDLLLYSRLQTKEQVFSTVNCSDVVDMALANLQLVIAESAATINCQKLPEISGDKSQILQLFQNLIANAIKFRGQSPVVIEITATKDDNMWLFQVSDNAIGLDLQFAERIFLIFQRLHTKEEYVGSGIGLAVCKKVVARHGGNITVVSEPGQGATFQFTIPVMNEGK